MSNTEVANTKTLREVILESVDTGCRAGELVMRVIKNIQTEADILEAVDALVANEELIEIVYTVPNSAYRLRSFYLPAGADVQILFGKNIIWEN